MNIFKSIGIIVFSLGLLQACSDQSAQTNEQTAQEVAPTAAAQNTYSAEEFYQTTQVFGSSINHDGTAVLMGSDETGIFNIYSVPLDGSEPTQLTHSTVESIFPIGWFPNDNRFLYNADQGGNELDHIYVQEPDGTVTDLTPGENLKASAVSIHENDTEFYIMTNERDPRYYDLYKYQTSDYSREMMFQNDGGYTIDDVSPDGKWLALGLINSNADSNIYLVDLTQDEKQPMLITEHQGNIEHSTFNFTRDSNKLIYSTTAFSEYTQAWSFDISNGAQEEYFKADWDVWNVYFSKDGKYRVAVINDDASTKLDIIETESGGEILLPDLPDGDLRQVSFSNDSNKMVFYINSDTSPSNLYVHELGSASATRLTDTGNPKINENDLVASEVVRFESFDGLPIPGLLYKPKGASADNKVPALVWVHGGPGGQSRKGYNPTVQHLVNNGYAVFRINNRGSTGYGKTFFHMDDKRHGDVDLKDVVYNKYYLQSLDWVDADRIGVIGGSYGGYMTMAAMAFTDEFDVGINIFGVTNWVRTLKSIPPHWEAARKSLYDELGDPETDEERLRSISPVFFGHQVKSPVLVVQGANDPRVLQVESDDMVAAIREGGTHVDYLIFDDEGHGFTKKDNRIAASDKYLKFLDEYLR